MAGLCCGLFCDPAGHAVVGGHHVPFAEAVHVLIQRLPGLPVPEAHRVHADLVAEIDCPASPPELYLEVYESDALRREEFYEQPVDLERGLPDLRKLVRGRELQGHDQVVVEHRVVP